MMPTMLLAGDVGGTKVDLGIFTTDRGPRSPLARAQFASADHPDLLSIVRHFLDEASVPVDAACFAVAGPVLAGHAKITNLPWSFDEVGLARDLGVGVVHLLNDLEAITTGVLALATADFEVINAGAPRAGGAIAVLAPGTGLGEGFAVWDGVRYRACPSEGGHSTFAPADDLQAGLLAHVRRSHDHVSFERVCSGRAIPTLYQYLRDAGRIAERPETAARLAAADDGTPVIIQAGVDPVNPDPLCVATIELFVDVLGAEAGNLALKVLATGGVFLAGGIPPRIRSVIGGGRFMRAFTAKGRLSRVVSAMPVRLALTRAALIGAAIVGLDQRDGRER